MFANRLRFMGKTATAPIFRQHRRQFNTEKPFSRENIPVYGAIVGVLALTFQITVLYPWHEVLSVQFAAIENAVGHLQKFSKSLDDKMDKVMALEEQVKLKERKILEREEEILQTELKILERLESLNEAINRVTEKKV